MSSIDSLGAALQSLRQSHDAGRLAHAYLVIGSPRGNALALTESFLQYLFCRARERPCGRCADCGRIKGHAHPDVMWMEPESKSRRIVIGDGDEIGIRDMNRFISVSPRLGTRKVGVLLGADRMTEQAANAFLKTLEEPSGSSLLMLITDSPQHLLPTIFSRCQRIVLSAGQDPDEGFWRAPLVDILRRDVPSDPLTALAWAGGLKRILEEAKKRVAAEEEEARPRAAVEEDEDVLEARLAARAADVRSSILRCVLLWQRDVLVTVMSAGPRVLHFAEEAEVIRQQAHGLTYAEAMARVRAAEVMIRRLERSMPEDAVFEVAFRE